MKHHADKALLLVMLLTFTQKLMRISKPFLACLLSMVVSVSTAFAQREPEYKAGEVLIKFKPLISSKAASVSHAALGARVAKRFTKSRIQLVKLRAGLTTKEAIKRYKQDPTVEYAEPNYTLYAADVFPNDPMFDVLWGLHNTGQTEGTPDVDIDAPDAWQMTTGSDEVIVAVIDTGVDYEHADLSGNMWVNDAELNGTPGEDDDSNGYVDDIYGIDTLNDDTDPMDDHGHGTHCAGTIGAVGNNGIGIVGVNWNVKIMALKFLGTDGYGDTAGAIECLEYVVAMKHNGHNIRIASNSWGGIGFSWILYDTVQAAGNAGVLFVAAAGNDSEDTDTNPHYPSGYDLPTVIAVAATDHNDNLASFSNWGPTSVDVAAPGVSVFGCAPGNNYTYKSGTSTATPHVSGLAALILSQHPEWAWDEVKWNILSTVDPVANLDGFILTGGRINANNALPCTPDLLHILISSPPPQFDLALDTQTVIKAWVGTCEGPVSDATVTVDFSTWEASLTLHDNGVDPDIMAGDGEYVASWSPQAPGNATLTITASASGYESVSEQVSGAAAYVVADFTAEPTEGHLPLTVQFTDLSQSDPGIEAWQWDFGDGGTSTDQNPSHTYNTAGTYTVSLTATCSGGSDTKTKTDYVRVEVPPYTPYIARVYPRRQQRWQLVRLTGDNFGSAPQPGDQVRIGKRWQYQYDVANPGTYGRTLRVRTWSDTRIWVRLRRLPSSWEGTWKRVWVVKENGGSPVVSNYGLLKILSP